ncbi:MAG: transcription antitermination factor NusB [Clostridia bacterium]
MSSTTAREITMKLTFARLVGGEDTYANVLEKSGIVETPTKHDFKYSDSVIAGIDENASEIDDLIVENLHDWTIERIGKVDLCILRIAVYELLYMDSIPPSVSIGEAVKLAQTFCDADAYKFINGVLGSIALSIKEK